MKAFVTGANGFIGTNLAGKLAQDGHQVTVLVRKMSIASEFAGKGMQVVNGDIFDKEKLRAGIEGCDWVFHLAAYARPTSIDNNTPYRTNVEGTINILDISEECRVKKVVLTSTAGTMGFSKNGLPVSEETNKEPVYQTEYERTKALTERLAVERSAVMNVTVVNPSRVFGPGKLTTSNSVTRIIKLYGAGLWRIIPGDGTAMGNYSYISDVVNGHILAAMYGKSGERYILGGENLTFTELFDSLGKAWGRERRMFRIGRHGLKRITHLSGIIAGAVGKPALISDKWIDKYLMDSILSSNKARIDLSYNITPFAEALQTTVDWLKSDLKQNGK